jgi:cytochrome c oxidase subunit 2
VHLPLDRPVKVLLRSHDVLHDFFVPEFRARMNIVPGQVSTFWFTPTRTGRYEAMCAQLCGVGHPNMRGTVIVEAPQAFEAWLKEQPTFAALRTGATPAAAMGAATLEDKGRAVAQARGCVACHSSDGTPGAGPTWKGLFGRTETFADGTTVRVNEDVLQQEIREPQARIAKGFAPIMPKAALGADEVEALVAYIKSLGEPIAPAAAQERPR